MHECYVLHRDLHTANVLLSLDVPTAEEAGSPLQPRKVLQAVICDFGLACELKAERQQEQRFEVDVGVRAHRAPELILAAGTTANYGEPADLWSCGILIVAMTEGYPRISFREKDKVLSWWTKMLGPITPATAKAMEWSPVSNITWQDYHIRHQFTKPRAVVDKIRCKKLSSHLLLLSYTASIRSLGAKNLLKECAD